MAGTTYTNSTGKPIGIAVGTGSGNFLFTLIIDGVAIYYLDLDTGVTGTLSTIIPAGSTYSVTTGGGTITNWFELR